MENRKLNREAVWTFLASLEDKFNEPPSERLAGTGRNGKAASTVVVLFSCCPWQ